MAAMGHKQSFGSLSPDRLLTARSSLSSLLRGVYSTTISIDTSFERTLFAMRVSILLLILSNAALAEETLLVCDGYQYFNYTFQVSSESGEEVTLVFDGNSVNMSTSGGDFE